MRVSDGEILRVDLSTHSLSAQPSSRYAARFLGGRGVNQSILFNELPRKVGPYEADNVIAFGTGPLAGTPAPAACRLNIDSLNPFTGGIGSSSCGGNFAPELKFAGYTNVVVRGISDTPVYLFIDDERAELRDASGIWGLTTWDTDAKIKEEIGDQDLRLLYIGPAGENVVRAACIITDLEKAAGRCGLGAVMGSKRLKAIAVRGRHSIEPAHSEMFRAAADQVRQKLSRNSFLKRRGEYGIYGQVLWRDDFVESPWRNFQGGYIPTPEQTATIHPDVFREKFKKKNLSCFSCPIHCRNLYEVVDGPYAGLLSEGLTNNDILLFGAKLNVFEPSAILHLRSLCSQYGLDTDNATGAIAWACECFQRGIIDRKTTDGLALTWGNYEAYAELLRRMTNREGFGGILGEGSKRASQIIGKGSDRYAVHIKGQDLMENIWVDKGWALGTVVSPRGGTHTRGATFSLRLEGIPPEVSQEYYHVERMHAPKEYRDKAKLVTLFERLEALADSVGLCTFATIIWAPAPNAIDATDMARLVSAATGDDLDVNDLMLIGQRIHNLEKAFNVLHTSWGRAEEYPPRRFVEEPVEMPGLLKGECLRIEEWDKMLDEYLDLNGWDRKTSWPTRKTLDTLGLKDVGDSLEEIGKLPTG